MRVLRGRLPRTDPVRAALLLWGGWLVVTGLVFSFMSGTVHPYYTVALAPAIGALVGVGGALVWQRRATRLGRVGLAAAIGAASGWGSVLLSQSTWLPWLRWVLLVSGLLAAATVLLSGLLTGRGARRMLAVAVLAGTLFGLGGTAAYAVGTASVPHSGSIPTVGAVSATGAGQGMGVPGGGTAGGPTGGTRSGAAPSGSFQGGQPGGASGSASSSGTKPAGTAPTTGSTSSGSSSGTSAAGGSGRSGGGATSSAALTKLLAAAGTTWSAAVDGSQSAATLELSSGTAVMAIGGWSSDPTPTLAQFEAAVAAGRVRYYIASGSGMNGGGGQASTSSAIATWVGAHFSSSTVGGATVHDLTDAT